MRAPLPDLSCDALPPEQYRAKLEQACAKLAATGEIPAEELRAFPSILMGLETAVQHLRAGGWQLWESPSAEERRASASTAWSGWGFPHHAGASESKLAAGFRCIKIKIGAICWERELELLRRIRERYSPQQVELRVDANGAFSPQDAPARLQQLAAFHIHSIEQPIRAGQWQAMAELCRRSPCPWRWMRSSSA